MTLESRRIVRCEEYNWTFWSLGNLTISTVDAHRENWRFKYSGEFVKLEICVLYSNSVRLSFVIRGVPTLVSFLGVFFFIIDLISLPDFTFLSVREARK